MKSKSLDAIAQRERELIQKNLAIDQRRPNPASPTKIRIPSVNHYEDDVLECITPPRSSPPIPTEEPSSPRKSSKIPVQESSNYIRRQLKKQDEKSEGLRKLEKELDALRLKNHEVESTNDALRRELRNLRQEMKKLTSSKDAELADVIHDNQHEISELQRAQDSLKEQIKRLKNTAHADVSRINKQQEEISQLKAKEKQLKTEISEMSNKITNKNHEIRGIKKGHEKQLAQLLDAYKKQTELIHVLRQQKLHIEAAHVLKYTEDEFMQLLDWRPFGRPQTAKDAMSKSSVDLHIKDEDDEAEEEQLEN